MRKALHHLAGAAFLAASFHSAESSAVTGGTLLTSRQERIGIFEIRTSDGTQSGNSCTATVLYSSVSTGRTWLVTAAHCFSYHNLYYVYRHFPIPRASVGFDLDGDTSGTREAWTSPYDSTVYVHPEWLANGGHTAWFGPRDVALIRVNWAIPIFGADGVRIEEFRRPLYVGPPFTVSAPYTSASMEQFSRNGFCGQAGGQLRCDTLSNLWWTPSFRHTFLQLPAGAWRSGFYQAGDSGGPLLKYGPGLNREWNGAANVTGVAMYGVVLGVLQGPTVFCDYIQNGNCNPSDGLATHFFGINGWLAGIPFSGDIPRIGMWTFANLFRAAVGTGADSLSDVSQNAYTFPAYPGKIVGVGVDKSTDRVHVWYDNGSMTIGTRSDLDAYSQVAPFPDLLPRYFFAGAPGRSHSQIVAMMINPNGNVHTWYADGTTVVGSTIDLDAVQAPRLYRLPAGKSPADIVAIASRPGGGVFAFYRDGTVSEGWFDDLDLYRLPRPFQTGNGRRPEEILDIDTYSNGRTVTLFDQAALY